MPPAPAPPALGSARGGVRGVSLGFLFPCCVLTGSTFLKASSGHTSLVLRNPPSLPGAHGIKTKPLSCTGGPTVNPPACVPFTPPRVARSGLTHQRHACALVHARLLTWLPFCSIVPFLFMCCPSISCSAKPPCHPSPHDHTSTLLLPDTPQRTLNHVLARALAPSPEGVSGTWGWICVICVFPAWALARHTVGAWRDLSWGSGVRGGQFHYLVGRTCLPISLLMAGKVPMATLSPTNQVSLKFLSGL